MIVRELTGGVYFGEPRGITDLGDGQRRGSTRKSMRLTRLSASRAWPPISP